MFCTKCGKQVEGNAEFCTQCGVQRASASPGKPKESNKTRNIVIGVIIGVVAVVLAPILIAVIILAVSRFSGEGGTSDLPQNLEIGQSAENWAQKVTVLSVDREEGSEWTVGTGQTIITVNAQVENIGADSLYATYYSFSLGDSEGNRYDSDYWRSTLRGQSLYTGEKAKGTVGFVVPSNADGLRLAYALGGNGEDVARWQLN